MNNAAERLQEEKCRKAERAHRAIKRVQEDLAKLDSDITAWENGESAASDFRINAGNVADVIESAAGFRVAADALAIIEQEEAKS